MSAKPDPWRSLRQELRKMQEQIRRQANASPFFGTGLHPNEDGGLDLDGTLNVDGEIVARSGVSRSENFDAGVAGWRLDSDGDAEFNDLTLRGGIIGNSALTDPVIPKAAHADGSAFGVTTSWSTKCTVTVTIPSGATKALISATVNASAKNGSGASDWLYATLAVSAYGGGLPGWVISSPDTPDGAYTSAFDSRALLLTGLSGPSFDISGELSTGLGSWGSDSANVINLDAAVTFLR